ncbi:MAG: hypothetical protein EOP05_01570 [Proteobacteria bacterium]|nr:MAG: hypothetical protein EOP05_01570 [Pseudomonadota bacterium]
MIKSSLSTCSLLTILTLTALLSLPQVARAADLAGCEENLKKSLCYADPVTHWALANAENLTDNVKRYQDRACLPAPESVFKKMVDVYRLFPVEVQKSFCEIKRIFIVKGKTDFGAVAEYYFDIKTLKAKTGEETSSLSAKPTGYLMEISEQNRFGGETASNYLSRVLQARFGQASKNGLAKDLPIATYRTPFGNDGALATTIVHEIGHMLSRAQRVTNSFFETKSETVWTQLSWKFDGSSFTAATIDEDFQQRIRAKELKRADLRSTLRFMKKSAIPTLYVHVQLLRRSQVDARRRCGFGFARRIQI